MKPFPGHLLLDELPLVEVREHAVRVGRLGECFDQDELDQSSYATLADRIEKLVRPDEHRPRFGVHGLVPRLRDRQILIYAQLLPIRWPHQGCGRSTDRSDGGLGGLLR